MQNIEQVWIVTLWLYEAEYTVCVCDTDTVAMEIVNTVQAHINDLCEKFKDRSLLGVVDNTEWKYSSVVDNICVGDLRNAKVYADSAPFVAGAK